MNDLYDALRQRAESAPLRAADLDTIRGRARSIRRRRAAVAVGGSVAAVAVIAGLGFAVAPGGADRTAPPVASTSAVPTESTAASDIGTHYSVTTNVAAEGTTGAEPQLPYWDGSNLVAPDGSQTPLKDRPEAFALAPDGSWWVVTAPDGSRLRHLSADGRTLGTPAASVAQGVAAAPGHLATIAKDGGRWVLTADDRTFDLGDTLDPYARIDGFLANGDVVFSVGDPDERVAHLDSGRITSLHGASIVRTSASGQVALAEDDGSWLTEDAAGADDWTVDWAGVSGFSPDGRYVALVGDPTHRVPGSFDWDDPNATSTLWIRNAADDSPLAVFTTPKGGLFRGWTWEGDDLLALVFERDPGTTPDGTWSVVRLSADGYTVLRGASRPGRIDTPPYVFGTAVAARD